jgi:hypothetical protein
MAKKTTVGAKKQTVSVKPKEDRRMPVTAKPEPKPTPITEIPPTSVLAPLQRKGIEGTCLACGGSIRVHYGHRNTWLGCQAKGLQENTTFILVPARRRVDARIVKSLGRAMEEATQPQQDAQIIRVKAGGPRYEVVYVADGRVKPQNVGSDRLQQVFIAVKASKRGLGRKDLLKKLRASNRPGIVDGAVRRLVTAGVIHARPVSDNNHST